MKISIDTEAEGLEVVLKDYQAETMKLLWAGGEYNTRQVWVEINKRISPKTISRASIINFLAASAEDGIVSYRETTGKGGYRRIYKAAKTEVEFWKWLIQTIYDKLTEAADTEYVVTGRLVAQYPR